MAEQREVKVYQRIAQVTNVPRLVRNRIDQHQVHEARQRSDFLGE